MLTLLSECHFWTTNDEIRIKSTDFGAFKYATKRDLDSKCLITQGKNEYAEKRDGKIILSNRKPTRLKDVIRKFEEILKTLKIVHSEWRDASVVQIMFSNGLLVYICINNYTGDIHKMAFDKYFVGKLAADVITDAVFTRQNILLSYNTNQVTVVYLQRPNMRRYGPEKIGNMDPRIFHVLIPGPAERKLSRQLVVNSSFDLVIVWTKSSQNELCGWRPTIRDQDRANIHVYKVRSAKLESVAYCWTENDPICVEFLRVSDGQILTVEQKISRKGEITAEICSYDIGNDGSTNIVGKMQRIAVTSIPIGTQICCHSFSPDQEKLMLGTIDRYVCVYDLVRKITKFAPKTDIIPTHCAWHPDSGIIMISNDRSQFQCFDLSLSFVANQLISEDVTPSNLLDLSHYFAIQPTLLNISFSCKTDLSLFSEKYAQTDCYLLLTFENGPIGCLRFFAGTGMTGDFHNSGLTPDVLINKYLAINQLEKAINVLLALNWETYGAMCLISLHKIATYIFTRGDVKRTRNELLMRALQTFTDDLSEETKEEFGDQIIDLKRRYFVFLLRNKLFMECFEIARNIDDYDLFMDLFNITKTDTKLYNFSREAYRQAEYILSQQQTESAISGGSGCGNGIGISGSDGGIDTTFRGGILGDTNSIISSSCCSHSSCSDCIKHGKSNDKIDLNCVNNTLQASQSIGAIGSLLNVKRFHRKSNYDIGIDDLTGNVNNFKNYVPPLPYFKSPVFNAENIKINIPKSELRIEQNQIKNGYFKPIKTRNYLDKQYHPQHKPQPPPLPDIKYRLEQTISNKNLQKSGLIANRISMNNFRTSHQDISVYNSNGNSILNSNNNNNNYQVMDILPSFSQQLQQKTQQDMHGGAWSKIPDQTLGIPLANNNNNHVKNSSILSSSYKLLPRASTISNYMHYPQNINNPQSSLNDLCVNNINNNNNNHSNNNLIINNNSNNLNPSNTDNLYNLPKFYQHPLVSGTIPSTSLSSSSPSSSLSTTTQTAVPLLLTNDEIVQRLKKPATSILSNSLNNNNNNNNNGGGNGLVGSGSGGGGLGINIGSSLNQMNLLTNSNTNNKKDSGEKNKVKFSDTVHVAVVPEIPRKEKSILPKRNGFRLLTDPKKELADSLPLCSPNDDYLKDFNPITEVRSHSENDNKSPDESNQNRSTPTIKVVHFGVV